MESFWLELTLCNENSHSSCRVRLAWLIRSWRLNSYNWRVYEETFAHYTSLMFRVKQCFIKVLAEA